MPGESLIGNLTVHNEKCIRTDVVIVVFGLGFPEDEGMVA